MAFAFCNAADILLKQYAIDVGSSIFKFAASRLGRFYMRWFPIPKSVDFDANLGHFQSQMCLKLELFPIHEFA